MAGFQKKAKGKKLPEIPGTRQSLKTFSLLTPSGIPSLDSLIGGGLPIGSVVVLNLSGDGPDYTKVVMNHFLSQGYMNHGHDIFVASGTNKPVDQTNIMQPSTGSKEKEEAGDAANLDLKIAWRYKDQASHPVLDNEQQPVTLGNKSGGKMTKWTISNVGLDVDIKPYKSLFKELYQTIGSAYVISESANVIRIGINDMDSAFMMSGFNPDQLTEFLFALKSLARHKLAVVVVSLTSNTGCSSQLKELTDFWFDVEGFQQRKSSTHHGFFTISKMPNLKTIRCPISSSLGKYHFKSTKSKFILEKIHLPPAEFESQESKANVQAIGKDW